MDTITKVPEAKKTTEERVDFLQASLKALVGVFKVQELKLIAQAEMIKELQGKVTPAQRKPRNITASPECIAFAAYLRDKEKFSVRQLEESGVLSYSKAAGLNSWNDEYLQDFLEQNDIVDMYDEGVLHEKFDELVPNYATAATA